MRHWANDSSGPRLDDARTLVASRHAQVHALRHQARARAHLSPNFPEQTMKDPRTMGLCGSYTPKLRSSPGAPGLSHPTPGRSTTFKLCAKSGCSKRLLYDCLHMIYTVTTRPLTSVRSDKHGIASSLNSASINTQASQVNIRWTWQTHVFPWTLWTTCIMRIYIICPKPAQAQAPARAHPSPNLQKNRCQVRVRWALAKLRRSLAQAVRPCSPDTWAGHNSHSNFAQN